MPINKLALIRYKAIDHCLQNRFRKWTLEDLIEAVSEAVYEYEGISSGVSRRTVQLDIQNMRSEKLGYNAPIVVTDKKYYTYSEKNYSITNTPVTRQDLSTLNEVVGILKQFKGFGYFNELTEMVSRLEDKVYKQQHKGVSYIHFEKNELLKGLEFIDPLHKAISGRKTLEVNYRSFKADAANAFILYPYLLKEYRNRWFLLGSNKKNKMVTLALDRIISFKEAEKEKYLKPSIDIHTYYDDVVGVSKVPNQKTHLIVLHVDAMNTPYLLTKPLHPSQQILKTESSGGMIFSINVVWNFELEREILGFGESIKVLSPQRLRNKITMRIRKAFEQYAND